MLMPSPNIKPRSTVIIVFLALWAALSPAGLVLAWNGHDQQTKTPVDVDRGALVKNGETLRFYDYDMGEYRTGIITAISFHKSVIDVEIRDEVTGELRFLTLEN